MLIDNFKCLFVFLLLTSSCSSFNQTRGPASQFSSPKQLNADDLMSTFKSMQSEMSQTAYSLQLDTYIAKVANYRSETVAFSQFDQEQILQLITYIHTMHEDSQPLNDQDFNYHQKKRTLELLTYTEQYLWELLVDQYGDKISEDQEALVEALDLFTKQSTVVPEHETIRRRIEHLERTKNLKRISSYRLYYSVYMKLDELLSRDQRTKRKLKNRLVSTARKVARDVKRYQRKNKSPLTPIELFQQIDRSLNKRH